MNEDERDEAYTRGSRMAWVHMLQQCCHHLGYDDIEAQKSAWLMERELAISMLRQVCKEHGDNDWPDDLHLADVIEKHLWRNLESP